MKYIQSLTALLPILILTGCGAIGKKDGSMATLYGGAALFALFIFIAYLLFVKAKNRWFTLMLSSIVVVNSGYYLLATSNTLEAALRANRISYLGSAMLPLAMMFIIFNICKINYKKWVPWFFFSISCIVFLIAASPGYLDIYYQKVTFELIDGVGTLNKTYGPWHSIYLYYLIIYFSIIVGIIVYSFLNHKNTSHTHAIILAVAVFVNIGVWLTEQLVKIDFEFLSISYIISECFLLLLHLMINETEKRLEAVKTAVILQEASSDNSAKDSSSPESSAPTNSQRQFFISQLKTLTPTEKRVYELYVEGKSTKEVLSELNIKENTLKYHN